MKGVSLEAVKVPAAAFSGTSENHFPHFVNTSQDSSRPILVLSCFFPCILAPAAAAGSTSLSPQLHPAALSSVVIW